MRGLALHSLSSQPLQRSVARCFGQSSAAQASAAPFCSRPQLDRHSSALSFHPHSRRVRQPHMAATAAAFIGRLLRRGDASVDATAVDSAAARLQQQPQAPAEEPLTAPPAPLLSGAGGGIFFFHQLGAPPPSPASRRACIRMGALGDRVSVHTGKLKFSHYKCAYVCQRNARSTVGITALRRYSRVRWRLPASAISRRKQCRRADLDSACPPRHRRRIAVHAGAL